MAFGDKVRKTATGHTLPFYKNMLATGGGAFNIGLSEKDYKDGKRIECQSKVD